MPMNSGTKKGLFAKASLVIVTVRDVKNVNIKLIGVHVPATMMDGCTEYPCQLETN